MSVTAFTVLLFLFAIATELWLLRERLRDNIANSYQCDSIQRNTLDELHPPRRPLSKKLKVIIAIRNIARFSARLLKPDTPANQRATLLQHTRSPTIPFTCFQ